MLRGIEYLAKLLNSCVIRAGPWPSDSKAHAPDRDLHSPVARHLLASPVCVARMR